MQLRLKKIATGFESVPEAGMALPFLALLFALKALVCYLSWHNGFLEYDTDGFTRSLHAWEWGQHPRFEVDAWLPLQFWLNGTLMQFWHDIFREPRAVNLLASLVTTVNFFFIGRYLFGRWVGYASALLVALFPWEIWFGLSGMSESLTHMFLSLGVVFFCRWLKTGRERDLWLTSAGLLGATMLRYEAWFYSLTYAGIVLFLLYRRELAGRPLKEWPVRLVLRQLLPVALAFGFVVVWVIASTVQLHSPLGFVEKTSEINKRLEKTNQEVSLFGRLIYYPQIFFELLRPLSVLAILGSLWLLWRPVGKIRIYLALVWGEFALFIISTLPTNNIAPGSARYPVSNLMLLLPVVVYLFGTVAEWLPRLWMRVGLALIFLGLPLLFVQTTLDRSNDFPDNNMRQVALWFKEQTAQGKLPKDTVIPAHFPNPLSSNGSDYAAIYGLSVLTNRPDGWRIDGSQAKGLRVISDIDGFEKTIIDDKPNVWLQLDSAGDQERINKLGERYRDKLSFGPYKIFARPIDRPLDVTPTEGTLNQTYVFSGEDFEPGERVYMWISYDTTGAKSLQTLLADANGRIKFDYKPGPDVPGTFSITARGDKSQRRAVVEVKIR